MSGARRMAVLRVAGRGLAGALALSACALLAPAAATGPAEAPSRAQTLSGDLLGPRVEWLGIIVESIADGDDTCFVLERVSPALAAEAAPRFIACAPGPFPGTRHAPGQGLRVAGNLGSATARRIGERVLHAPLVAGAFLFAEAVHAYAPPYFYDPLYPHPWGYPWHGPYWGFGIYLQR